ncbi:hypothetical protein SKAU_G00291990 [Synaphobranchus kaupii]|uniref:Uncharacterized protein n=1 Tax=Synaphobranchus kaupii TaxID=118154 RepID=A0A9Q1ETY3_SYNKA|nr:hypothetical protein SKAU_G00291990 [Synaphobranchus kaupii]
MLQETSPPPSFDLRPLDLEPAVWDCPSVPLPGREGVCENDQYFSTVEVFCVSPVSRVGLRHSGGSGKLAGGKDRFH